MTSDTEDKVAIADLFTRYCCALDNGEVETVVDCFTADAALKSPMIDLKGHAAIRDFVGQFSAQQAAGVQFPAHGHKRRRPDRWRAGEGTAYSC
jgi:ketosteroid isomerase-like protein